MRTKRIRFQNFTFFIIIVLLTGLFSFKTRTEKKTISFKDYPNLKLGFSSQNFLKAMPLNVESLSEIIEYASKEGYQFVEVRDQFVDLTND